MQLKFKNYNEKDYLPKFLEGGEIPADLGAPVDGGAVPADLGGGDPLQELLMACLQAVQTQDCQLAIQVCQVLLQSMGGGEPVAPAAPEGLAPVYRAGGKLSRWVKK